VDIRCLGNFSTWLYTWIWALPISQRMKWVQDTKFRPCHSCVGPNLSHTLSHSLSLITPTQHLCTAPRAAELGFHTTTTHLPSPLKSPLVAPLHEKQGKESFSNHGLQTGCDLEPSSRPQN
jgi:hypothetical protein